MRPRTSRFAPALALAALVGWGCGGRTPAPPATPPKPKAEVNAIPPEQFDAALAAHLRGLGHMEQYEYADAVVDFREVRRLAPGWIPGAINLAIALLNDIGANVKSDNEVPLQVQFAEPLELLEAALKRDPDNLHAHYCRGLILDFIKDPAHPDRLVQAHKDFLFVAEHDPNDGDAWLKVGDTLIDPDSVGDPDGPRLAGPEQSKDLIKYYSKALECNPYLVSAMYKLAFAYGFSGDLAAKDKLLALWDRLNPEKNIAATGEKNRDIYGSAGRYAWIIGPPLHNDEAAGSLKSPRFEAPKAIRVTLPEGSRWAKAGDFEGSLSVFGRARARFGATVATFDADGDDRQDLYLAAAVVGPKGVRDALLRNRGDGAFEDVTAAFHLPDDRASLGVAAGDFDADGHVDLYLTGVGDNRLVRNVGGKGFADITGLAGVAGPAAISPTARWIDLDQDGDLDLYVVNFTGLDHKDDAFSDRAVPGLANAAYRNDGKPAPIPSVADNMVAPVGVAVLEGSEKIPATKGLSIALTPWPDAEALGAGREAHAAVALLDIDNDRDLDLVVDADGVGPSAVLNDRLGRFRLARLEAIAAKTPISGLLVEDLDKDGRADLVAVGPKGPILPWINRSRRDEGKEVFAFDPWPTSARGWRSACVVDLDLDGWPDLLGPPGPDATPAPVWARNTGRKLDSRPIALGPDDAGDHPGLAALAVDLVGDPLPDLLVVKEGVAPRLARNLGNGHHWAAFDLRGRWKGGDKSRMRTNPQALGARLALEGAGLDVRHEHTSPEAGLAQSVAPVVLGLGTNGGKIPLVRLRWPDGVWQCELNEPIDKRRDLFEWNRRKETSCPVVFTWDGERFVCIGDFLGGGGLGYLVAPGTYSNPDRDEALLIGPDRLRPSGGVFRLSITEPMSEVSYFDRLTLDVVDATPGVDVGLDERFAPTGPRPSGEVIPWRKTIEPVRATDLKGKDITAVLRRFDRRTADDFRLLNKWVGYAEEHGIVLDFGDRLAKLGPDERIVLALAGWVEYPYSQTNYAASTAGVALKPPVLERRRADGTWELVTADVGYPAGLPRLMTLELPGKALGPGCVLRIRTNMECYYDQAFLAVRDRSATLKVSTLPVSNAVLGYRGYMREVSPDGRPPLLYDYDSVDPAPLVGLAGTLTRYGDVAPLLRDDDDRLCLVGPGDEVRLEFDATSLPPLPEGWTRRYVLRGVGYCKDADPFTAASDTVGPLPWKGMPPYPFGPAGARRLDEAYRAYLEQYQTRPAGER
ncbi:MAG TPA: FG-GAP-like repeat-containing protein [Isosphaeraceae bacterium]|jgi:tetratricopeptide (TPR) repeat protein|nr:FG-GAP-like repeat-containing protein [Isosphaeraceae bacterium]